MIGFIRSCLTSGVAVLGASGLVITPVAPLPTRPEPPPVALAALAQPLTVSATAASIQPLELLGQQVSFHIGFVTDFVVTGAQLVARQVPIPGTLLSDIQNGTSLPVAVGHALQTFADVEIDAGRELVGFARQYVHFQIDFLAKLVRDVMTTVSSTTIAFATFAAGVVGQLVSSVATGLTAAATQAEPMTAQHVSASPAPAPAPQAETERHTAAVESTKDATGLSPTAEDTVTRQPRKPKQATSAVEAPGTVTVSTVTAQGQVRSATTGTTEASGPTATHRNDVSPANKGADGQAHSTSNAAPEDKGDASNTPPKDNAPSKNSVSEKP